VTTATQPTARRSPTERDRSLNAVRAVIPARCYQRPVGRALAALVQAGVLHLAVLVGLALTDTWWLLVPLWILAGLGVSGLFVLGHDASHGALVDSPRMNRLIAQFCMLPSAHVEAAWALGHNRIHHGYTTRQGFDFVWHPLTPAEYRSLGRLARLRHRLEWSWLGSGLYFGRTVWWQKMVRFKAVGERHARIGRDKVVTGIAVAGLLAAAGALGFLLDGWVGIIWVPVKLLVIPFLLFIQIIGWTVYVHHVDPGVRWWKRKEWTQFHGQMESTTILRINRVLNRLWFHNIFVHVPHHVDARIPFHQLPRAAEAIMASFPQVVRSTRYRLRDYIRATRACKLYDFERGRWVTYADATTPAG
jgi:acyl-lipid omega-6 desaturase (Delta-12 desaturase)